VELRGRIIDQQHRALGVALRLNRGLREHERRGGELLLPPGCMVPDRSRAEPKPEVGAMRPGLRVSDRPILPDAGAEGIAKGRVATPAATVVDLERVAEEALPQPGDDRLQPLDVAVP